MKEMATCVLSPSPLSQQPHYPNELRSRTFVSGAGKPEGPLGGAFPFAHFSVSEQFTSVKVPRQSRGSGRLGPCATWRSFQRLLRPILSFAQRAPRCYTCDPPTVRIFFVFLCRLSHSKWTEGPPLTGLLVGVSSCLTTCSAMSRLILAWVFRHCVMIQ